MGIIWNITKGGKGRSKYKMLYRSLGNVGRNKDEPGRSSRRIKATKARIGKGKIKDSGG